MDERTSGVIVKDDNKSPPATTRQEAKDEAKEKKDPQKLADRLEHDVDTIRGDLDRLFGELDRRRHDLFDVRLQLRRHALPLALTAVGFAGMVGGLVALGVWRARAKRRPISKARRLRSAVARMIDKPDNVARKTPSPLFKFLTAVGTTIATLVVKRGATRMLDRPRVERVETHVYA